MADKRRSSPHFFKVLIPGFLCNFCIPKSFLKHLGLEESTDGNDFVAVLNDPSWSAGNEKDKSWLVQVDSDGRRFLNGWKEFADDHGLRVGEFLVFKHCGGFVFDVVVFDPVSASHRSFSAEKTGYLKSKGKKSTRSKRKVTSKPFRNPYFQATVQKYCFQWYGMIIPIQFARDNGLVGRWCEMTIMDEKDRSWPVTLKHRVAGNGIDQSYLSTGWGALAAANELKVDDPVAYELLDYGSHPIMKFYKGRWPMVTQNRHG